MDISPCSLHWGYNADSEMAGLFHQCPPNPNCASDSSSPNEVTIIVPAKDESQLLPILLESLCHQDYPHIRSTKVFVADGKSVDSTDQIALSFASRLNIMVIPGGLPSVGRNAGALRSNSRYLLFIDADMELKDPTLIRRSIELADRRKLDCVTTNIWCSNGTLLDHLLYIGNNLAQYGSMLVRPFSTGMFMLFRRTAFEQFGGFHESALYAEDYLLTKRVPNWHFGIVHGRIYTTNRRFVRMGHLKIIRLFVTTMLNTWNKSYFLRDHAYWQ